MELLAARSGGDARIALGALERAAATSARIDLAAARDALAGGLVRYDRAGDQHYDTISAWIKATRGSDPDASLYYLATMLEGGESDLLHLLGCFMVHPASSPSEEVLFTACLPLVRLPPGRVLRRLMGYK